VSVVLTPETPASAPEAVQPLLVWNGAAELAACALWQSPHSAWRLSTPANSSTWPLTWLVAVVAAWP
jgi:hypothetical protein